MQSQKIDLPSNLWVNKRPYWPWSSRDCSGAQCRSSRSRINHQQAQLKQLCYNLIDTPIKEYSIVTFSAMLWVTQHANKSKHFPLLWASPPCYLSLHFPFSPVLRLGKSVCQIRRKMGKWVKAAAYRFAFAVSLEVQQQLDSVSYKPRALTASTIGSQ